jgi:hypothetical protein
MDDLQTREIFGWSDFKNERLDPPQMLFAYEGWPSVIFRPMRVLLHKKSPAREMGPTCYSESVVRVGSKIDSEFLAQSES